jgi:hypothetical protein
MKKYLGLLFLILLLNGCDDGDVTVESINFDDVNASTCGNILYKIEDNQALFVRIPASYNAFENEITPVGTPDIIPIGGEVEVRYRTYNGNVTSSNICPDVIQPIFPVAVAEWNAIGGFIEIATTPIYATPDPVTGATKLVKYNHNIVFKPITFSKPVGQQRYDEFPFGDFTTDATLLALDFPLDNADLCPSQTTLYNVANSRIEAMFIQNLDPALLSTTNLNVPKSGLISSTANKLSFRLFETALPLDGNADYFCAPTLPAAPTVKEEWFAENGVSNVSGIIEVTTTSNVPNFVKHTIRLKGVTFRRGDNTFYYGNDILWGELILPI